MKKYIYIILFLFFVIYPSSFAFENTELIEIPTADVLMRADYNMNFHFWPEGGLLFQGAIGVLDRLMMGVSYGAGNVIGEGDPLWNPDAKIKIKFKIFEVTGFIPSFAIGYNSQGYGNYNKTDKRFARKSKGFFAVASRELPIWEPLRLHAGMNRSLEDDDGYTNENYFFGIDYTINPAIMIIADYDQRVNDEVKSGKNEGTLNAGFRWIVGLELSFEFDFLNILENDLLKMERMAKISYVGTF